LDRGNIRAWVADGAKTGEHYVAIFNLGDSAEKVDLRWSDVGLVSRAVGCRDLWTHKDLGRADGMQVQLPAHASVLYRIDE
jgi:hypothetical protein